MTTHTIHKLKTHPDPFKHVQSGAKTAEFRLNDRNFQVGDVLRLEEYDPETKKYTGFWSYQLITHIQKGYGIPENYVMLSLARTEPIQ
jgi:hypothetical protein